MSLNERSFSDLSGAVLMMWLCWLCWPYIRSGSTYLVVGVESRGLCSSPRIDLVLFSRLKGFGLFFLEKFAAAEAEVEAEAEAEAEVEAETMAYARGWSVEGAVVGASVLGGAPTGLRVVDLSRPDSVAKSLLLANDCNVGRG